MQRKPNDDREPRATYIAVAGNIGSGKSTLVAYLASRHGFRSFPEPYELNPYLKDFYKNMGKWAFHSQISFLAHKFRVHLEMMGSDQPLVQDLTIYEDAEIFARHLYRQGYMDDRDWATYRALYEGMTQVLRPPDLLIYLRCGVRSIRQRIEMRGRVPEQNIPTKYLQALNRYYDRWVERYSAGPILVWPSDRMNYLEDLVYRLEFEERLGTLLGIRGVEVGK